MKIPVHHVKRIFINIIVDGASVIFIAAATITAFLAITTLYTSYYQTLALPTPESFSTAAPQFATAISFIFAVFFTRKYRVKEKPNDLPKTE